LLNYNWVKKDQYKISNPILAKETLDISLQDLMASRVLFDNGSYPASIFHLQQSIEKGCKSFGFHVGVITEKTASSNKIGHTTTNIYLEIFDYIKTNLESMKKNMEAVEHILENNNSEEYQKFLCFFKMFITQISESESKIKDLEIDFKNYANKKRYFEISNEKLIDILNNIDNIEKAVIENNKEADDVCDKVDIITSKVNPDDSTKTDKFNIINNLKYASEGMDHWFAITIFLYMNAIAPLLVLAIITQPHEQTTRYIIDDKNPKEIYNSNHPIIKNYEKIYDICKDALQKLKEQYDSIS
jgi:HEPN domain-containing protein